MAITTVKNRAKSGRAELGAEGRAGQGKERLDDDDDDDDGSKGARTIVRKFEHVSRLVSSSARQFVRRGF